MRRSKAYTLVELLMAMAILLILSALAYPSYAGFLVKAHRAEAQVALVEAMQVQERYYSQHNTYLAFSSSSSGPDQQEFPWWLGSSAQKSTYELSGRACGDQPLQACIELHAEPGTAKVDASFRDTECGTLTLDSAGRQGASGKQTGCWP